jgi:hypothetical protein
MPRFGTFEIIRSALRTNKTKREHDEQITRGRQPDRCHPAAVAVPRFEAGSRLETHFIAIDEGQRKQVGRIVCEDGKPTPTESYLEPRMTGLRQGPTLQHDAKAAALRLSGLFATLQDPTLLHKAFDAFGWHKNTNVYADNFEMKVKYCGPAKNTANLMMLFALSNLWMVRKRLLNMGTQG